MRRASLLALAVLATSSSVAVAADFTWNGGSSPYDSNWSNASNWSGGAAPSGSVGTISFPAAPCTSVTTCGTADDIAGLTVSNLDIVNPVGNGSTSSTTAAPFGWTLNGSTPLTLGT